MISFVSRNNAKRCVICPLSPPVHPPICAVESHFGSALNGANGGTEGGQGRIVTKDDLAEQIPINKAYGGIS